MFYILLSLTLSVQSSKTFAKEIVKIIFLPTMILLVWSILLKLAVKRLFMVMFFLTPYKNKTYREIVQIKLTWVTIYHHK